MPEYRRLKINLSKIYGTKQAYNGRQLSAHQQNTMQMAFCWWVDSGPKLYACLVESSTNITVDHYQLTSEKPFVWHFAGGSIVAQKGMPA